MCKSTTGRNIQSAGCRGSVQGGKRNDWTRRTWWRVSDLTNQTSIRQDFHILFRIVFLRKQIVLILLDIWIVLLRNAKRTITNNLKCTLTQIFLIYMYDIDFPTERKHIWRILPQNFAFLSAKLSKLAVIWTHDRDARGMGLFSILRHKLQTGMQTNPVWELKSLTHFPRHER